MCVNVCVFVCVDYTMKNMHKITKNGSDTASASDENLSFNLSIVCMMCGVMCSVVMGGKEDDDDNSINMLIIDLF